MKMPTAEEMAASGFTPEDYALDDVEVWPENWAAWSAFCDVSGQWRMSAMGGAIALDYGPVFTRLDRLRLSADDWEAMFQDVRVIEAAALEQMRLNG